ncbi:putative helicase [Lactobacillus phage EV3]|nr:putative helicase [Lactobacillus phage EV3]
MYQLYPHQQDLVNQARNKFKQGKKSVLIQSPAGSGKSVMIAEIVRNAKGHVLFMVHRQELVDQIKETLINDDIDMKKVSVMTVGKVKNRLDKLPKPSLIITDESHHSLAKTYLKIYEFYKDVPRIGFTATPWRMNKKDGLDIVYEDMVEGKSVQWLIDNHYLAPYKYFSVDLTNKNKLKASGAGDYTKQSMEDAFEYDSFGDVVSTYQKVAAGTQAILYAPSVEYSKIFAEEFEEAGITAVHADAKTPKHERNQIMSDFKSGKIKILCNVDLISEGFNVPDCETVIMCRPTKSLVIYIQQSMRSMRYKPNKQAIIIDHVANYVQHGMPNTEHQWSLKSRGNNQSDEAIMVCPWCLAVGRGKDFFRACDIHKDENGKPINGVVCYNCKRLFDPSVEESEESTELEKDRTLIQDKDIELKDITNIRFVVTKNWREAKSREELYEIAKQKGYKPGWAYYKAKQLNL